MSISSADSFDLPSEEEVQIGTIGCTAFKQTTVSTPVSPFRPPKNTPCEPAKKYYQRLEGAPSYVQRFEVGLERTDLKRQTRQQERDLKEMAECTFAPVLTAKQGLSRRKTMPEMYIAAVAQAQQLQERRETALEKERQSLGPFKPTLNSLSLKLAKSKRESQEDLYTYLHRTKTSDRPRKTYFEEKPTFHPSINPKSAGLLRTQNIEDLLMEDAHKRQERQVLPQSPSLPEKLINPQSEKVLSEKFEGEFTAVLKGMGVGEDLRKAQGYAVLRELHFLREVRSPLVEELWAYLDPEGREVVPISLLLSVLLAIQRLPSTHSASFSPQALASLQHTFQPLHTCRQKAISKSRLNPTYKFQVNYPFQPDITKTVFTMVSPRTERTSLKSEEMDRYFEAKREEAGSKVKFTVEGEGKASRGSILGRYMQISQSTVKRPQDRNEALFRLAALQLHQHS